MNLKLSVEPKMIHIYWQDGLVDTLLGLGLVLIGIAWQFDLVALAGIVPAIMFHLWLPIRSKFVEPKLGYVSFTQEREQKNHRFMLGMALASILALALTMALFFFTREADPTKAQWIAAMPAGVFAVPIFASGIIIKSNRFFAYAGLLLLAGFTAMATEVRHGIALLIPGIIILFCGLTLMAKFNKSTDQSEEE